MDATHNFTNKSSSNIFLQTNPKLANMCKALQGYMKRFNDPLRKEPELRQVIITIYTVVAIIGVLGNLLVVLAVLRKPQMRTHRNMFIINLSISDLLMCSLTAPFTLKYILNEIWDLGRLSCKIVSMLQAINIFVSTLSITAIGLDRYIVILFPAKIKHQRVCLLVSFLLCWALSVGLATPMFLTTDLQNLENMTAPRVLPWIKKCGYLLLGCNEVDQQNYFGSQFRRLYTLSCFGFQYLLPLVTLGFVYGRIIVRLRRRTVNLLNTTDLHKRRDAEERQMRISALLICLVVVFAICWLPLNVYIILGTYGLIQFYTPTFAYCHACGMISASVNPILYGLLNENFRKEFVDIMDSCRLSVMRLKDFLLCRKEPILVYTRAQQREICLSVGQSDYRRQRCSNGDLQILPGGKLRKKLQLDVRRSSPAVLVQYKPVANGVVTRETPRRSSINSLINTNDDYNNGDVLLAPTVSFRKKSEFPPPKDKLKCRKSWPVRSDKNFPKNNSTSSLQKLPTINSSESR